MVTIAQKMLYGLPLIDHSKLLEFRLFVNSQLKQHATVAAPHIPLWEQASKCPSLMVNKGRANEFGPLLLAITPAGEAAFCPITGGAFFDAGVVQTNDQFKGMVLCVSFLKRGRAFMGGTFVVLDILSYNSTCLLNMPQPQRFAFIEHININSILVFPPRYTLEIAHKITASTRPSEDFVVYGQSISN